MQTASTEPRAPDEEGDQDCIGDDELLRFVGGAVDDARASEIRAHVDLCDDCRELLAIAGREAAGAEPATAKNRADANDGLLVAGEDRSLLELGAEVEGRFRIEREIGRGGMGVVYAASHLAMRKKVAFKVLNEETAADDECVVRFLRETRALASLISPHAVRVFDVGRLQSGAPYMVMELLEGQDLEHALDSEGVFAVPRALDAIAQACHAVGEAHLVGIVHRDIKLANLFLADAAPHPIVKVLDFGLAKGGTAIGAESSLTHAEALMGTPHYMPPEQLASSRDVDARADVWSLGVALYRLLTKRYPFNGAHFAALAARILAGSPVPPSHHRKDLPAAVDRLVMKCLARDPKDRYADANELARAIASALQPSEPITKPVSASDAAARIGEDTLTLAPYPSPPAMVQAQTLPASPRALPAAPTAIAPIPERISTVPMNPRPGAVVTAKTPRDVPAERPMWPYVLIVSVIGVAVAGAVLRRPASSPDGAPPAASIAEPQAAPAASASAPGTAGAAALIAASASPATSAPDTATSVGRPGAHGPRRGTKPGTLTPRTPGVGAPATSPPPSAERH